MLYDASEEPLLKQVLSSKAYPALKASLDQYVAQIVEIEREMAKLKERDKVIKRGFAHELANGKVKC